KTRSRPRDRRRPIAISKRSRFAPAFARFGGWRSARMTDAFKDRSAGLIIFGSLQILLGIGALCALFGIAAATEMQSHGNAAPAVPAPSLIANILIYALGAFYFFAVGIGSIRKRRWARALSLVVSAMWLAIGIVATAAMAIMLPHFLVLFPPSQTSII